MRPVIRTPVCSPPTSYSYRVRAYNRSGTSAYSNTASATTQARRRPAAPSNLAAVVVSSSQINLTWTDNADKRERVPHRAVHRDGLHVLCGDRDGRRQCDQLSEHRPAGLDELFVPRARLQSAWNLGVFEHGERDHPGRGASGAQQPPTVVASSSQINLTWTDTSTNESGFRIERCNGTGCTSFAEIATVGANTTGYQNSGLTAGRATVTVHVPTIAAGIPATRTRQRPRLQRRVHPVV